ncbi:helix-turn-helix domain-containing protein [Rhodococcus sp. MTM3W5.2]|uniref:helix-turn-helix domain-containing protein n=1 Tax=Rhodococcus sp. MTM3W5.2 TaxID=1805827 RepID=UPI0009F97E87
MSDGSTRRCRSGPSRRRHISRRAQEERCPTSALDRLALFLNGFRSAPRLSLTELSRRTGIPRTTTLRMLEHLVRMGWDP